MLAVFFSKREIKGSIYLIKGSIYLLRFSIFSEPFVMNIQFYDQKK